MIKIDQKHNFILVEAVFDIIQVPSGQLLL